MRTIAHISDLHFGRIDMSVAEGLVADLATRKPTVLVNSGDFTQRGRSGQYRAAAALMTRLPRPQICVPGNHDIPLFDVIRRFLWPLDRYRKFITPDLRPVYQDDELLVIGMNSARSFTWSLNGFWKDGRLSEEQLHDIELRSAALPAEVFKVVVTHHPFIPPPHERLHGIIHGAPRALAEMERHGIDMLLAGHLHMGYSGDVRTHHEGVLRSILSVQAGTATSTRRRGEPNAYNWITIDPPDRVTIEVRAWDGNKFVVSSTLQLERHDGNWRGNGL